MNKPDRKTIDLIQETEEALHLYRLNIIMYVGGCGIPIMRAQTDAIDKMKLLLDQLNNDGNMQSSQSRP